MWDRSEGTRKARKEEVVGPAPELDFWKGMMYAFILTFSFFGMIAAVCFGHFILAFLLGLIFMAELVFGVTE